MTTTSEKIADVVMMIVVTIVLIFGIFISAQIILSIVSAQSDGIGIGESLEIIVVRGNNTNINQTNQNQTQQNQTQQNQTNHTIRVNDSIGIKSLINLNQSNNNSAITNAENVNALLEEQKGSEDSSMNNTIYIEKTTFGWTWGIISVSAGLIIGFLIAVLIYRNVYSDSSEDSSSNIEEKSN